MSESFEVYPTHKTEATENFYHLIIETQQAHPEELSDEDVSEALTGFILYEFGCVDVFIDAACSNGMDKELIAAVIERIDTERW